MAHFTLHWVREQCDVVGQGYTVQRNKDRWEIHTCMYCYGTCTGHKSMIMCGMMGFIIHEIRSVHEGTHE